MADPDIDLFELMDRHDALDREAGRGKRRYNRLGDDDLDEISRLDDQAGGGQASIEVVAERFAVSNRTAQRYLARARQGGTS